MPFGPPQSEIVLVHGMWGCAETLDSLACTLREAGYKVHQPTLPLHKSGLSAAESKDFGSYGIPQYVTWLKAYLEDLQLERPPILVGHSMGGLLVQHLAAQLPCCKLVLLAPASPAGINCITPWGVAATMSALVSIVKRKPVQRPWIWQLKHCLLNDFSNSAQQELPAEFLQESIQSYIDIVFWFLQRHRPSAVESEAIQCPVLLLAGKKDRVIRPGVMRKIARRYPQCTLEFLPEHGHMMVLPERSQEIGARLLSWLKN